MEAQDELSQSSIQEDSCTPLEEGEMVQVVEERSSKRKRADGDEGLVTDSGDSSIKVSRHDGGSADLKKAKEKEDELVNCIEQEMHAAMHSVLRVVNEIDEVHQAIKPLMPSVMKMEARPAAEEIWDALGMMGQFVAGLGNYPLIVNTLLDRTMSEFSKEARQKVEEHRHEVTRLIKAAVALRNNKPLDSKA